MSILQGKAWKLGHDIDTDLIISARYLNQSEPSYLAARCFEDLDPELVKKIRPGDILVAGRNFGCGSSREHAPVAIKHAGFACVIAESYARIFYRNAINIGLPIIIALEACRAIEEGAELEVEPTKGIIRDLTNKKVYEGQPLPPFMMDIVAAGGLIPYVRGRMK